MVETGEKYTIGLDYGTLSGRGVLVRCSDGYVVSSAAREYEHGVLKDFLPDGNTKLPPDWCLQYPQDYIDVLDGVIPELLREGQVDRNDIIGIGIDFTASTVLPVDGEGSPLCFKKPFEGRRNAYVKLWKHHGAQAQADKMNSLLKSLHRLDDPRFGGKISPELMVPKALEILQEDREVYDAAAEILEAGDWLTRILTGSNQRSCSMAGYKMWWNRQEGYPDKGLLKALDSGMEDFAAEKLPGQVCQVGEKIGGLSDTFAKRLGLREGIAVAPAVIDSHAGFPGSGITRPGQMMMVLGTSSVMLTLSREPYSKNGVCGGVRDAIVPGYYALESGLAAVGDLLGWFVDYLAPMSYDKEAKDRGITMHQLLSEKAGRLKPGESGLLALDWWNGNKTPYVDANLRGGLIGMTLDTRPEEIYRALIEATAFGTRAIMELFEESGSRIDQVVASGGIAVKNPVLMQIYADVLGVDIQVAGCDQAAALGSAIYAALAAGEEAGGYATYEEAVLGMTEQKEGGYRFDRGNKEIYDVLYDVHRRYGDLMGRGERGILKALYDLKINRGKS